LLLDPLGVLCRIEKIKAFRAEGFKHHLVNVLQRIGSLQVDLLVLFVFSFSGCELHVGHLLLNRIVILLSSAVSLHRV